MLSGDFQAKLRKVNPDLRVYSGNDDSKPAGICHKSDPEVSICGVDKNFVPEHPIYDEVSGRLLKGGWKRALRSLIEQKYIDRRRAEKVFGSQILGTRWPTYLGPAKDRIESEIQAAYTRNLYKNGKPAMTRTELMDIASEVTKNVNK